MEYFNLPLLFLKFWFFEAPLSLIKYFAYLNSQFLHLFSLTLMIKTLFVPWKNEYRKEFIPVALGLGIFIKAFFIIADLILFLMLLIIEFLILIFFIIWPFLAVLLLFK
jgi:hypothetical protein